MTKSRLLSREVVFFADFLPASGRHFPGLRVSPVLVNAPHLSSPPQFRSKDAADPTHAPTLRHRIGRWQKAGFSLSGSRFFFVAFLTTSGYFPGLCVSPAVANTLRLSSPPQFRPKDAADPTHASTLRHRRGRWQKPASFS